MRLRGVDALRGLAIVLMVLDHVLAVTGEWVIVRQTVTRASLPLFMIVAGSLLAGRNGELSWKRYGQIVVAGCFVTVVFMGLGLPAPDVLVAMLVTVWAWPLVVRFPVTAATAGALQTLNWPLAGEVWTGYEPGFVLLFLALGVLVAPSALDVQGQRLPAWLATVGRYPLRFYVGHVAALVPLAGVVTPSVGRG